MANKDQELLKQIKNSQGHNSAEDIFLLAKKNNMDISLASVYRILTKLSDEKKIKKIYVDKDYVLYDRFVEDHEHLVCDKCGKVSDINISNFRKQLEAKTGISIDSYDLCIHYICDNCKKKGE